MLLMPGMVPAATPNVFLAGLGARGDPAGSAAQGTRWICRHAGATGPIDWRHVGDPVADGYRDKAGVSCDKKWRVGSEDLCRYIIYYSDPGARSTASSEHMACSGENG
ncbi:hypothetical protein TIFTF001_008449 [Ficus carica]|uniref:Uncharacterized protein n=1 Tax=Ficus carica TaxID=3494 RepID=A0AA88D0J3_FICCA|nr:hypothetical protein TIFTF001_008449 [Ficus carica]